MFVLRNISGMDKNNLISLIQDWVTSSKGKRNNKTWRNDQLWIFNFWNNNQGFLLNPTFDIKPKLSLLLVPVADEGACNEATSSSFHFAFQVNCL